MSDSPPSAATVLVTGGSGFLGGHAVKELLGTGHSVRTTVRSLDKEAAVRDAVADEAPAGHDLEFFEADLGADEGWVEAVAGCDYVLHIASPFPPTQPKDAQELIGPARDGALRVIRASLDAGVKRVVMTSSTAAIRNGAEPPLPRPYTEDDWTDPDLPGLTPYAQSKTIAERAAWDLVRETGDTDRLTVVNPSAILGPVLGSEDSTSLQIVRRMLDGMPGVPRLGFSFVDVRDTADLHIRAMTSPDAGGRRFIAAGPFLWMLELADLLRAGLPEAADRIPTRVVPKPLIRAMGLFDPGIRSIISDIGKESHFSAGQAKELLNWQTRPIEETVTDCGRSMLANEV